MSDYALVPVEYPPDFEDISLVPVDHDPFSDDDVTQQAQTRPAPQPQQAQTRFLPAIVVDEPDAVASANNTQASEPSPPVNSTPQTPVPVQVNDNGIPQAVPPSGLASKVVTPQQMLQGAINQFYPGAQFTGLAQQAFKDGQFGNAIGYGAGAVADSLLTLLGGKLALAGGKVLGTGIAARANAARSITGSSRALRRALERAGHVAQAEDHAHHIVAQKKEIAEPARVILRKLGIGIHDAANGVFLDAAEHNRLHKNEYLEAVNKALAGAKSKAEAEQILQSIAARLRSGTFP